MIAHIERVGCFTERGYYPSVRDRRKILRDIIARGAVAAQRAGDNYEIANLDMFLQRAAATHPNQRLGARATENFSGNGRIRRVATAVADGNSLAVQTARVHLVVEKCKIFLRIFEGFYNQFATILRTRQQSI